MSIEIKILLPDEQVHPGALDVHMKTLGYRSIWLGEPIAGYGVQVEAGDEAAQARQAYAAQEAQKAEPANTAKAARGRKKAEEAKPAISTTPEDRQPPEEDAATEQQDAADEAAEVEAARDPENPVTVEDLRGVMGEYVNKFTLAATQEDGPLLFASVLGAPPAGEPSWKLSLLEKLPQEKLRAALEAWQAAVSSGQRYRKKG